MLNHLGTYQATPNIPGMPTIPALSTNPYETTTIPSGPINLPGPLKDQNPIYSASTVGFNASQSHVVTTPISLPGMPPITVSASLPQNTSFYPSVLQQNELPSINVTTGATTMATMVTVATATTTAPPMLTPMSTQ